VAIAIGGTTVAVAREPPEIGPRGNVLSPMDTVMRSNDSPVSSATTWAITV
jgi:hypothetical protein